MWKIVACDETDSTNDDAAAALGSSDAPGTVFVADVQRRGRGRHERRWIAPAGTSLLCTANLPEPVATAALWSVPFWTGLALADAIEAAAGVRATLQWPNDLLLDGAKVAGILCVSRVTGDRAHVGCGTGVNVRRPHASSAYADIVPPPAFLDDRCPMITPRTLLDALLAAYANRRGAFDDPSAIAREWEIRADLDGTPYRLLVDGMTEPFTALARRIAPDGGLVVDVDGATRTIALADARVLRTRFTDER